jgi:hypothetical protein
MVNGAFELDTSGMKRPPMPSRFNTDQGRTRRVA